MPQFLNKKRKKQKEIQKKKTKKDKKEEEENEEEEDEQQEEKEENEENSSSSNDNQIKNISLNSKFPKSIQSNPPSITTYILKSDSLYSIDGSGDLSVLKGQLNLSGYTLSSSKNNYTKTPISYVENYPLFKYTNCPIQKNKNELYDAEIQISSVEKCTLITHPKILSNISPIPKELVNLNFNEYSIYYIVGKKNCGKNVFCPYIINRLLMENKKIYFLDCDLYHPYVPFPFCLNLFEINYPIFTNEPFISNKELYELVRSVYVVDIYDINNVFKIIKELFGVYDSLNENNKSLIINCYSNSDSNAEIYNSLIYQILAKEYNKCCTLFFQNIYQNDKDSNLDNIILNNKIESSLINCLIPQNNEIINKNNTTLIVTNNYDYNADSSNTLPLLEKKKQLETDCLLYHYKTSNQIDIPINNIVFIIKNELIINNIDDFNLEDIVKMFLSKHCALLIYKNNFGEIKVKCNKNNVKFATSNCLEKLDNFGYAKFNNCNFNNGTIQLFTNNKEGIIKYDNIFLLMDNRIDGIMKDNRTDMFMKYISNCSFKYNILSDENTKNNPIKAENNISYLSRNSFNFI